MDLDIIKIAADTSNNKILEDYTHKSKYKNKTCGDYIEIRLEIKKNQIKNIGYQTKSCVYCQASTNLVTNTLIKKTKNKLNYLLDNLVDYFEDESDLDNFVSGELSASIIKAINNMPLTK